MVVNLHEGTMKATKIVIIALCSISPLASSRADAGPIIAAYNASLSVHTTIRGVTDEAGNTLPGVPSDLSILGRVIDVTGFGFFATLFGPSRPADITESSFAASGDVIVNGAAQGDGPIPLGIGDGLILNSMVSGAVQDFTPDDNVYVTSDVSQYGELAFVNSSLSNTYLVDILVTWAFAVDVENNSLLSSGFSLEGGYALGLGTCCVNGTDFFFENGFIGPLGSGAAGASAGVHSFSTQFAATPGGPDFAVRPFIGGLAGRGERDHGQ